MDVVHLGNARAFPTFPQRWGGYFLTKTDKSLLRMQITHLSSLCVETDQEFVSYRDANDFWGFAGCPKALLKDNEIRFVTANYRTHDE